MTAVLITITVLMAALGIAALTGVRKLGSELEKSRHICTSQSLEIARLKNEADGIAIPADKTTEIKGRVRRATVFEADDGRIIRTGNAVLVRDTDAEVWVEGIVRAANQTQTYETMRGTVWGQCIPREGNENLRGTNEKPKRK